MENKEQYKQIYDKLMESKTDELQELIAQTSDPNEQEFYNMIADFILQQKQKEAIAKGVF